MINKIVRGTSGKGTASSPVEVQPGNPWLTPDDHYWDIDSHTFYFFSDHPEPQHTAGWDVTEDGFVTIPSDSHYNADYADGTIHDANFYQYLYTDSSGNFVFLYTHIQFEIACLVVNLVASKVSSSPISGTSPQQYKHVYMARAMVEGGDTPFTYNWSTTAGAFAPSSPTGDTVRIEVINTSPSGSNVSGIVECTVTDSDSCEDTASAEFGGATGSEEGPHPCLQPILMDAGSTCSSSSTPQQCLQPTGNNIDGGSGNGQGSNPYTGGSGLAGLGVNEAGNNNGSQPNHQPGILHAF